MQSFVSEYIPDILSKDHSKEVGIAIISAWYYAFNALNKRYTFLRTVPSVLTSTIAAWISLNMLKLCDFPENTSDDVLILNCGPPAFNDANKKILEENGYK